MEQLKNHYSLLYTLINHEIQIREHNGDRYVTKLSQWRAALVAIEAMKEELKKTVPPEVEIVQGELFRFPDRKVYL
jgi:hypothetical protein